MKTAKAAKSKRHPHGTYAQVIPDDNTNDVLFDFITQNNIPNSVDDFHCTVVYSRNPIPEYEAYDLKLPVVARFTEFKLLDGQKKGTKALVVCLDTPEVNRAHYDAMEKYRASYDYQV